MVVFWVKYLEHHREWEEFLKAFKQSLTDETAEELILKRKIVFKQMPEVGNFIVFINTAGYMMHFYEFEAHLFDLANNLVWGDNRFILDYGFFNGLTPVKTCKAHLF